MKDLKRLFLCVAAFAACNLSFAVEALKPCKLTVGDFLENPLGMNIGHMGFNWKLPDRDVPTYQSAYRVRVASSPEKLSEPDIWDSADSLFVGTYDDNRWAKTHHRHSSEFVYNVTLLSPKEK